MSKIYALDRKNPLHGITEFLTTEVSYLPLKHLLLATIGYQYRLMISLIPRDIFSLWIMLMHLSKCNFLPLEEM